MAREILIDQSTDDLTAMVRIRNKAWLEDDDLKADLTKYFREGLSPSEILDFVRRCTISMPGAFARLIED